MTMFIQVSSACWRFKSICTHAPFRQQTRTESFSIAPVPPPVSGNLLHEEARHLRDYLPNCINSASRTHRFSDHALENWLHIWSPSLGRRWIIDLEEFS